MSINPFAWVGRLYHAAAAAGLSQFHRDLQAAATEAGIDPEKPLTVATLGELVAKVQPPAPPALPAGPNQDTKPAEPTPEPENGRRKKSAAANGAA